MNLDKRYTRDRRLPEACTVTGLDFCRERGCSEPVEVDTRWCPDCGAAFPHPTHVRAEPRMAAPVTGWPYSKALELSAPAAAVGVLVWQWMIADRSLFFAGVIAVVTLIVTFIAAVFVNAGLDWIAKTVDEQRRIRTWQNAFDTYTAHRRQLEARADGPRRSRITHLETLAAKVEDERVRLEGHLESAVHGSPTMLAELEKEVARCAEVEAFARARLTRHDVDRWAKDLSPYWRLCQLDFPEVDEGAAQSIYNWLGGYIATGERLAAQWDACPAENAREVAANIATMIEAAKIVQARVFDYRSAVLLSGMTAVLDPIPGELDHALGNPDFWPKTQLLLDDLALREDSRLPDAIRLLAAESEVEREFPDEPTAST